MRSGPAVAATHSRFEAVTMSRSAPVSSRNDLLGAVSKFAKIGVAVFVPDFGSVFKHTGPDALDLLHRITTNSLIDLPNHAARRTILTSHKGRIIDAPWVVKFAPDDLMLLSDASSPDAMHDGILRYTIIEDAELTDTTEETARLIVFGDNATESIFEAFPNAQRPPISEDTSGLMILDENGYTIAVQTEAAGTSTWLIVSVVESAEEISSRFEGLAQPLSDRSLFDFVRIRNGVPIAGFELSEDVNPLEASLIDLIDFDKGCYVGQEVIARLDTYDKVQRRLVGFRQVAESGDLGAITSGDRINPPTGSRDIGWITSVAVDPDTCMSFGLAYVRGSYADGADIHETSGGQRIALSPVSN